ncbi:MAG: hypothetical protein JSV38_15655 [Desulfobacterales bacterium]|nr:MAG: hypothetical protein JSV38_15655 [Desulfobacterales bacterium]
MILDNGIRVKKFDGSGIVLMIENLKDRKYWIRQKTTIEHFNLPIDTWGFGNAAGRCGKQRYLTTPLNRSNLFANVNPFFADISIRYLKYIRNSEPGVQCDKNVSAEDFNV